MRMRPKKNREKRMEKVDRLFALKDENGVIYGVHGDNMWVKFSYEK